MEIEHCGISLADQQIAVALDCCNVRKLASTFTNTSVSATEVNALGIEESFLKGSEIDPVTAVFLFGDIATSCGEISLGYIAQVFDLGEQFGSGKHLKLAFHYY